MLSKRIRQIPKQLKTVSSRQLSGQELPRLAARGRRGGRRGGFRGRGGGDDGRDGAARGSCGRHGRRPHGAMTRSCFGRAEAGKRLLKTNEPFR